MAEKKRPPKAFPRPDLVIWARQVEGRAPLLSGEAGFAQAASVTLRVESPAGTHEGRHFITGVAAVDEYLVLDLMLEGADANQQEPGLAPAVTSASHRAERTYERPMIPAELLGQDDPGEFPVHRAAAPRARLLPGEVQLWTAVACIIVLALLMAGAFLGNVLGFWGP